MPAVGLSQRSFKINNPRPHKFKVYGEALADVSSPNLTTTADHLEWRDISATAHGNHIEFTANVGPRHGRSPTDVTGDLTVTVTSGGVTFVTTYQPVTYTSA